MKKTLTLLLLFLGLACFASAQTILTNTTLSSAVPGPNSSALSTGNQGLVVVASATGISAPAPNTGNTYGLATSNAQTFLYVDRELMQVVSVSGTTIGVIRGVGGTAVASHASSAFVFVVPATVVYGGGPYGYGPGIPQGSCTRANEPFLPRIHFASGVISDCLNGQWVQGDAAQTQRQGPNLYRFPDPGASALTGLETAGTAPSAATEIYCSEVDIPYSMVLTGIASLNGTTVGTDKHWVILYDSGGKVLANSATAGATTSGASTYQKFDFTSKFYAVGPNRYFACVGTNGTTDTIRHAITAVNDNILGGAVTGQVFGTAAAVTVPSTFTTAKAPYVAVY